MTDIESVLIRLLQSLFIFAFFFLFK